MWRYDNDNILLGQFIDVIMGYQWDNHHNGRNTKGNGDRNPGNMSEEFHHTPLTNRYFKSCPNKPTVR